MALIYIIGGCGGGTDFISFSLSNKSKNLGKILFMLSFITTTIGFLLGSFLTAGIISSRGDFPTPERYCGWN
jgi:uncharacterized membrane-anchored protein YitT (DUF2179 family)